MEGADWAMNLFCGKYVLVVCMMRDWEREFGGFFRHWSQVLYTDEVRISSPFFLIVS
jgi:hypothetical protein